MPLGPDVKYRVHTTKTGKKIRLAFQRGRVIEAKNLKTGAVHTPGEFKADRKRTLTTRLSRLRGAGAFQGA